METTKSLGTLYAELGLVLFKSNRFKDAVESLEKAISEMEEGESPSAEIYLTLGRAYNALQQDKKALQAFSHAVLIDPNTFQEVESEIKKKAVAPTEDSATNTKLNWLKNIFLRPTLGYQRLFIDMASNLIKTAKYAEAEVLLKILVVSSPGNAEVQEALGWALLKQGGNKTLESLEAFKKAVELDDKRAYAHQGLGEAYDALGQSQKAAEALGRSLELKQDEPATLLLRGVVLRKLGKLEESEQDLKRASQLDPENRASYYELSATQQAEGKTSEAALTLTDAACLLLKQNNYKEAESISRKAISLEPSSGHPHLELGHALIGQKRYEEALASFNQSVKLAPTAEAYMGIARALIFQQKFSQALEAVNNALALPSKSTETLGLKGAILHRVENPQEALELFDKSLADNPQLAWCHAERGAALETLKRSGDALAAYREAVKYNPKSRWAHIRIGIILFAEEKYKEAVSALEQGQKIATDDDATFILPQPLKLPPDSVLYTMQGEALNHLSQYKEAIEIFDKALQLDPANANASYGRGSAMLNLGQYQESATAFQLTIDLYAAQEVEDARSYANLGEALRKLARYREARVAFKKAIELQTDFQWALARYGDTLRALEKYDEALEYLKRALQLKPDDGWTWGILGATKVSLKQHGSALKAFEEALKYNPSDAVSWAYKGTVLRLVRRYDPAIKAFDKALELEKEISWFWLEKGMAIREVSKAAVGEARKVGFEEALSLLEKAAQVDPNYGYAFCQQAICLYYLDRFQDALDAIEKGFALDSGLIWVNCLKSLVLEKLMRNEEAQQAHDQTLSDPSNPEAYLDRSLNYSELDVYDRAARDLEKALALNTQYAEAYNELAWLYTISPKPNYEEALVLAQTAVKLADSNGQFLDTLGWIYLNLGMLEEAGPLLEQADSLLPDDPEIQDHLEVYHQRARAHASI